MDDATSSSCVSGYGGGGGDGGNQSWPQMRDSRFVGPEGYPAGFDRIYNVAGYPLHLHRPQGPEQAIHEADPCPRCSRCDQVGHLTNHRTQSPYSKARLKPTAKRVLEPQPTWIWFGYTLRGGQESRLEYHGCVSAVQEVTNLVVPEATTAGVCFVASAPLLATPTPIAQPEAQQQQQQRSEKQQRLEQQRQLGVGFRTDVEVKATVFY